MSAEHDSRWLRSRFPGATEADESQFLERVAVILEPWPHPTAHEELRAYRVALDGLRGHVREEMTA